MKRVWFTGNDLIVRVAKNMSWAVIGGGISHTLTLLTVWFIARLLGQETFGKLEIINNTVNTFAIVAAFGLGITSTKYIAQYRDTDTLKVGRIIGFSYGFAAVSSIFVAFVIFLLSSQIATHFLNAPMLANALRIGCIILIFESIYGTQLGMLSGFEDFKTVTLLLMIRAVLWIPLVLTGIHYFGLMGAIVSKLIAVLISAIFGFWLITRQAKKYGIPIDFRFHFNEYTSLVKFSLPSLLAQIIYVFVFWLLNIILANMPNGFINVAIFSVAYQWQMVITFVSSRMNSTSLPVFANLIGEGNWKRFNKLVSLNIIVSSAISLLFAVPMVFLSNFVMGLYGPGYENAGNVLSISALTGVVATANSVIGYVFTATGKIWWGFLTNLLWAISAIIFAVFLLPLGATGLALAYFLAYLLHSLWQGIIFNRVIGLEQHKYLSAS